ncbi:hypothetical protein INT45_010557, partial [Circinella minor]
IEERNDSYNDVVDDILYNDQAQIQQRVELSEVEVKSSEYGRTEFSSLPSQYEHAEPIRSRIIKDVFHLMDQIKVPRRHGLANDFSRRLRDALFVVDEDDKKKVEAVLLKQGTTWNEKLIKNPRWLFRRVKRTIPPPEKLYPKVKQLFEIYGPLKCARTGRSLFDNEAWKQSKNILKSIHEGQVSDPPGFSFYFHMRKDRDGLPLYRCCRGTNSLEGGIHQNIIRKFGSFGASPELTDAVLADYRLRHNIDVGTINRYGRVHKGHYEPWLTQHINDMREKLGLAYTYNEVGVHRYASQLAPSDESFGIGQLPSSVLELYGIEQIDHTSNSSVKQYTSSSDLATLVILCGSTLQIAGAQHKFIARRQGVVYPILPVQTQAERDKFDNILKTKFSESYINHRIPDFEVFAKIWSTIVDGKNFFYKTPEHLRSYYNVWKDFQNI